MVKPPAEPVPPEISPLPFHTSGANRASERIAENWEPPPVRQRETATGLLTESPAHGTPKAPVSPVTRHRAPLMIAIVFVAVAGIAVTVVMWVITTLSQTEDASYASGLQQFNDKQYTKAENHSRHWLMSSRKASESRSTDSGKRCRKHFGRRSRSAGILTTRRKASHNSCS